jgi:hypothetical protein
MAPCCCYCCCCCSCSSYCSTRECSGSKLQRYLWVIIVSLTPVRPQDHDQSDFKLLGALQHYLPGRVVCVPRKSTCTVLHTALATSNNSIGNDWRTNTSCQALHNTGTPHD